MGAAVTIPVISDIVAAINRAFPPEHAEEWDRVGLLAGDGNVPCTGVVLALDPNREAVRIASERGANLLVTHHPAYLAPVVPVAGAPGGGDVVHAALASGVALANAHTNLDRDPAAQRILPELLGFEQEGPLERGVLQTALITVYCPPSAAERITEAMSSAGAGSLGSYSGCSFTCSGTGRFTPLGTASPSIGAVGEEAVAEEVRIEMTASIDRVPRVMAAARSAHPYEEPLIVVSEVRRARNAAALGMVASVDTPITLSECAWRAGRAFGITPRVWGDPSKSIKRAAFATGSAGSLVGEAVTSGVDVLVGGEVRYHDATEAVERGLSVVEIGHDVSEWPLVSLLADVVRAVPGIDACPVVELPPVAGWWTPEKETR